MFSPRPRYEPHESLPDGRVDMVRHVVVNKHASEGHVRGWPDCQDLRCSQYLEMMAELRDLRAAVGSPEPEHVPYRRGRGGCDECKRRHQMRREAIIAKNA